MTPRVSFVAARSSAAAVGFHPERMSVGTKTGRAPARRTISGKETQYGSNIATSSPSSKRAWHDVEDRLLGSRRHEDVLAGAGRGLFPPVFPRDGVPKPRVPGGVGVLRPAGHDRRDPGSGDEVRRGKVGLPQAEVHDVHAAGREGLGGPRDGRGRRGRQVRDSPGQPRPRHRCFFQTRAKAGNASSLFRPATTSVSSIAIHMP